MRGDLFISPKPRTMICISGIIIGLIAILFVSYSIGLLIALTSIYFLMKPQITDSSRSGMPKWWWRWLVPSSPVVEVGIIVNMILIFFGGMILLMGIIGSSFPSTEYPFPPIANVIIGLSIIAICIVLSKFLINREADDWHYRIANDEPVKIKFKKI